MKKIKKVLLATCALTLASCGPRAGVPDDFQEPTSSYDATDRSSQDKQDYPISVQQAREAVATLSPIWSEPVYESSNFDSFSDGESITVSFKDGALNLYTSPDGELWRVRLYAGTGERCSKAIGAPLVGQFVDLAGIPNGPDREEVIHSLSEAIRSGAVENKEINGIRFTGAGECVQSLTATVLAKLPA